MRHLKKLKPFFAIIILTAVLVFSQWSYAGHAFGRGRLIVWFFDVGQGDAIFIETPSGHQMLIDGGPGDVVISKLGSVMPFWDRAIDDVLLTHPHADHLDGLVDVVDRYRVSRVYISGVDFYTPLGPEFYARVSDGETVIDVTRPQEIDLGGGVILRLLYTTSSLVGRQIDDANASSLVGLLTYGETSVLLTGDITAEREAEIAVQLDAPVDVLKVAHHGSAYSSTMDFLNIAKPQVAVISVGADNDYGHPAASTLDRLRAIGAAVLRTDIDGDIRLISDGLEPTLAKLPL